VLAKREAPHKILPLNPVTCKINTEFQAQIQFVLLYNVAVTKSPTMVFVASVYPGAIAWARESTPTGELN
jgi:hypothetical protein